ncbi:RNA polymerase sigma factor [Nocardioides massiliensis]|uniref:RNA polymerase sigma-70 factor (ECF subfamily) n=1 Tax=Nocardioides massiliensis TaxID=1325935 RepID=A0ABT9NNW6_9ACTN|nr:sigma-70 family RNA polymerase sigma factor [Nocardioides massiliensis]MDP9822113.1 RNA polymerase sigma-70 factor (ECF subfamily) [Nocardioides massiliensis]
MDPVHPPDDADRQARFTALARAVVDPLRAYLVRRAPADADDVLAEVLLVLWRRLDDVPAEARLPWCYGVARGCLANARRAERRRARLADRVWGERVHEPGQDEPAYDDLHAALRRLPEGEQELLRLWAWEELEPREIAVVLGISPNAVSIRLHRARRRLAALLGESPAPQPDRSRVKGGGA